MPTESGYALRATQSRRLKNARLPGRRFAAPDSRLSPARAPASDGWSSTISTVTASAVEICPAYAGLPKTHVTTRPACGFCGWSRTLRRAHGRVHQRRFVHRGISELTSAAVGCRPYRMCPDSCDFSTGQAKRGPSLNPSVARASLRFQETHALPARVGPSPMAYLVRRTIARGEGSHWP
jgi:hypothetical protein